MDQAPSLEDLWGSVSPTGRVFDPADIAAFPEAARRYLEHAIAPGTPLASAVRLRMHGDFRLKGWCPFTAEQVNRCDGTLFWQAAMHLHGVLVKGFDSVMNGEGRMQWKLFGVFPMAALEGVDVTRSTIGRLQGEAVWLPSLLCGDGVVWTALDASHAHARFATRGETTELALTVGGTGRLEQIQYRRWGDPGNSAFHYADFGGFAEEEGTFGGYTVPTRLRAGWHFGTTRFASEGEFFRVTIDEARFR